MDYSKNIKMKIGIVTFHRATNCSAILQAYALVSYPKSLAHETEFIDCKSEGMASLFLSLIHI